MDMIYEKKRPEDLKVGDFSLFPKTVSASDVMMFAGLTGDLSPVYLNEEFGKTTRFQQQTAHPMLVAGMLGGAVFRLLSPDAYPVRREFQVLKPLAVGDTVTARAEVTAVDLEKKQVTLKLTAYNSAGEAVVEGYSLETMDIRE